jgi:hypothetical protein
MENSSIGSRSKFHSSSHALYMLLKSYTRTYCMSHFRTWYYETNITIQFRTKCDTDARIRCAFSLPKIAKVKVKLFEIWEGSIQGFRGGGGEAINWGEGCCRRHIIDMNSTTREELGWVVWNALLSRKDKNRLKKTERRARRGTQECNFSPYCHVSYSEHNKQFDQYKISVNWKRHNWPSLCLLREVTHLPRRWLHDRVAARMALNQLFSSLRHRRPYWSRGIDVASRPHSASEDLRQSFNSPFL